VPEDAPYLCLPEAVVGVATAVDEQALGEATHGALHLPLDAFEEDLEQRGRVVEGPRLGEGSGGWGWQEWNGGHGRVPGEVVVCRLPVVGHSGAKVS